MVYQAKGGIWKNTEDEILKAAVMKYGLNQWARISSLLVRKSASQCKARWYEWLDPSIKKTEWSRDEEERLLHLAKIMPTQWRTIAPLVGRTAAQCLEHYEKLLDAAQGKDEKYDAQDDPRKIRPGEIDPNPETKPARPDPVDMDEDEKEMLQEARARLANTKGKKAKRKAREKQLEEARRIAALQKQRELKAAGIEIHHRKKNTKEMDYNKEIPFLQQPPPGFYEVDDEDEQPQTKAFTKVLLQKLEGKRRIDEEDRLRRQDVKKQKIKEEKNLAEVFTKINKLNDPQHIRNFSKLSLPAPQITDKELEVIAKHHKTNVTIDEDEDTATSTLLSDYRQTTTPSTRSSVIRTPARPDTVMMEAQNILSLSHSQTPLKGGENTPLVNSDFSSATPSHKSISTPNVLMTPLRTPIKPSSSSSTPLSTPLRDQLNINADHNQDGDEDAADHFFSSEKRKRLEQTKKLQMGFRSLSTPKNEIKIGLPDLPDDLDEESSSDLIEDAAEVEKRKEEARKKEEERLYQLRSSPLKRHLPRPLSTKPLPSSSLPLRLLHEEISLLLKEDLKHFPIKGVKNNEGGAVEFIEYSPSDLSLSQRLIDEEMKKIKGEEGVEGEVDMAKFNDIWNNVHSNLYSYSPSKKKYVKKEEMEEEEVIEGLRSQFDSLCSLLSKDSEKAKKLEEKINVYTQGYEMRSMKLEKEIAEIYTNIDFASTELECFKLLLSNEKHSLQNRIQSAKQNVQLLSDREAKGQDLYKKLLRHLD